LTQQGPDISSNRRARKWSSKQLLGRALWETFQWPLFRWTPRQLWGWRRWILRGFGARVGPSVHIHPSVKIAIPWNLRIDENAAIGDGAIRMRRLRPIDFSLARAPGGQTDLRICGGGLMSP